MRYVTDPAANWLAIGAGLGILMMGGIWGGNEGNAFGWALFFFAMALYFGLLVWLDLRRVADDEGGA
ncbi:MAG: hypothetical protein AAF389_14765 [Gemmatimonadota bacterium]